MTYHKGNRVTVTIVTGYLIQIICHTHEKKSQIVCLLSHTRKR